MNFSIGVFAHNEEKNIKQSLLALLNQKISSHWQLKEIIVVLSGSTDQSKKIVMALIVKHPQIKLLTQKKRLGKVSAVNKFLNHTTSKYIIVTNADNIIDKHAINHLLESLKLKNTGMVCGRIIPLNSKESFFGFAAHLQWDLHHRINLQFPDRPKAGELIGFKRVFEKLNHQVAFDEANIEAIISAQGFNVVYCPLAIVYNYGPNNLFDFVHQRRRNYAGHLQVKKRQGHQVLTLSNFRLLGTFLANLQWNIDYISKSTAVMALEIFARSLGFFDTIISKKHYQIWRQIQSTKQKLSLKS